MKKYGILFLALMAGALIAACSRGDYYSDDEDIVGGHSAGYNRSGKNYMKAISEEMVPDVLEELELALEVDQRGLGSSAHFAIDGGLNTPGSTWTVKVEDSQLCGMTLHCVEAGIWSASFEGKYFLVSEENYYPTHFTLQASHFASEDASEAPTVGWDVSLSGEREEREGYTCAFQTGGLRYENTRGAGAIGWDKMYGDLLLNVYKNGQAVDVCVLSYEGAISQSSFVRGL